MRQAFVLLLLVAAVARSDIAPQIEVKGTDIVLTVGQTASVQVQPERGDGEESWRQAAPVLSVWLSNSAAGAKRCLCGEARCRGWWHVLQSAAECSKRAREQGEER